MTVESGQSQLSNWKHWVHPSIGEGQGLELVTDVDIPKGSGLGTSSILMLACIRALRRLLCTAPDSSEEADKEFNAVLAIEQMLTTGGGWQDQLGGGTGGLKYVVADPGVIPKYKISPLELSERYAGRLLHSSSKGM